MPQLCPDMSFGTKASKNTGSGSSLPWNLFGPVTRNAISSKILVSSPKYSKTSFENILSSGFGSMAGGTPGRPANRPCTTFVRQKHETNSKRISRRDWSNPRRRGLRGNQRRVGAGARRVARPDLRRLAEARGASGQFGRALRDCARWTAFVWQDRAAKRASEVCLLQGCYADSRPRTHRFGYSSDRSCCPAREGCGKREHRTLRRD